MQSINTKNAVARIHINGIKSDKNVSLETQNTETRKKHKNRSIVIVVILTAVITVTIWLI